MPLTKKLIILSIFILLVAGITLAIFAVGDKLGLDFESGVKDTIGDVMPGDNRDEGEEDQVDRTPLEISYKSQAATIYESQYSIAIKSSKEIELKSDNTRVVLFLTKSTQGVYWYVAEINNIGVGGSQIKFQVGDKAGNTQEVAIALTREPYVLPFGLESVQDWEGSTYTADGDNLLAQVDKRHKLSDDYYPEESDLVDVGKDLFLYANVEGIKLRKEAGEALRTMLLDMQTQKGANVVIISGFRSHSDQVKVYTSNVRNYGQEDADTFSARPGFSEHNLGTVVDLYSSETGDEIFSEKFGETTPGSWLVQNAYRYGFVLSYPAGKESITGYKSEPWHYRYIGVENASDLVESGLTLTEWLTEKNK